MSEMLGGLPPRIMGHHQFEILMPIFRLPFSVASQDVGKTEKLMTQNLLLLRSFVEF